MLNINLKRIMHIRAIEDKNKFLINLGFAPATARNLLRSNIWRMNFEHLEKICLALNCTPNDLLEWRPNEAQANPEAQALIKLKRGETEDLSKLMKSLPIEKFDEIVGIIQNLKEK